MMLLNPNNSDVVGRGHVQAMLGLAVSLASFPFGLRFLVPLGVVGFAVGVRQWSLVVVGAGRCRSVGGLTC